jgi:hypothetical protein
MDGELVLDDALIPLTHSDFCSKPITHGLMATVNNISSLATNQDTVQSKSGGRIPITIFAYISSPNVNIQSRAGKPFIPLSMQ